MSAWSLCLACRSWLHADVRRQLLAARLRRLQIGHIRNQPASTYGADDLSRRSLFARNDSEPNNKGQRVPNARERASEHFRARQSAAGTEHSDRRRHTQSQHRDRTKDHRNDTTIRRVLQKRPGHLQSNSKQISPGGQSYRLDTKPATPTHDPRPSFPSFGRASSSPGPGPGPEVSDSAATDIAAHVDATPSASTSGQKSEAPASGLDYERSVRHALAAKNPARREPPATPSPPAFDPSLTADWNILKRPGSAIRKLQVPPWERNAEDKQQDAESAVSDREKLMYAFGQGDRPKRKSPTPPPVPSAPINVAPLIPREPPKVPDDEFVSRKSRARSEFVTEPQQDDLAQPRGGRKSRRKAAVHDDDDGDEEGSRRRPVFDDDVDPELQQLRELREQRKRDKQAKKKADADTAAAKRLAKAERMTPIHIPDFVTMTRLAQMLGVSYRRLEQTMYRLGFNITSPDHILSAEDAGLAAIEHNFDPSASEELEVAESARDIYAQPPPADKSALSPRPPVVAIMGHVDHGKTTLLDYLRKTAVAAGEHGGITQHIGAFSVPLSSGQTITFLDTPGHSAFLAMRQRGAIITDIIVLVVAADDSVKPQTIEALKHAKAAGVPIIVAINKIDKEESDIQRVKNDLARHGVEIEDFGGDTQVIPVSGKTGQGLEELEEAIITLSEILDHRADPAANVEGWVIEATMKSSGRAATVLVRQGTLSVGDIIVAGQTYARVRTLRNEAGTLIDSALPGFPVEVDGWRDEPVAGDEVLEAPNEQRAHTVVEHRTARNERARLNADVDAVNKSRQMLIERRQREKEEADADAELARSNAKAAHRFKPKYKAKARPGSEPVDESGHKTVPFIIKADVSGSAEAVNDYVLQLANPLCSPTVLRSGVGPVTGFDIEHAAIANGHIIAFNLPLDAASLGTAERQGVKLLYQDVIYRIVEDVKEVLEARLEPIVTQRVTGEAEVASVFEISLGGKKKMAVAGCRVRNGVVERRSRVRVMRSENKVFDGMLFFPLRVDMSHLFEVPS